jgi:hypothetical protein
LHGWIPSEGRMHLVSGGSTATTNARSLRPFHFGYCSTIFSPEILTPFFQRLLFPPWRLGYLPCLYRRVLQAKSGRAIFAFYRPKASARKLHQRCGRFKKRPATGGHRTSALVRVLKLIWGGLAVLCASAPTVNAAGIAPGPATFRRKNGRPGIYRRSLAVKGLLWVLIRKPA